MRDRLLKLGMPLGSADVMMPKTTAGASAAAAAPMHRWRQPSAGPDLFT